MGEIILLSFRNEEKVTIKDEKFLFINILGGTGYERANEICQDKGMRLFEPRDAMINHMVWEKSKESYSMSQRYWLNVLRTPADKVDESKQCGIGHTISCSPSG